MVVIVMGVTGTGKTTVGEALAQTTGWQFADADDFHSPANRAKMHAGIPLTDEDREPWLRSLHEQIMEWISGNVNGILACSALRESYRATLTGGTPKDSVRIVYLTGPEELIQERMEARHGHYMPESLLPSQLATLEPPHDAIEISIAQTIPAMVQQILKALGVAREAYAGESGSKQN
jgi:gluconokinase